MANPSDPVAASFPVPPPLFNFPWTQPLGGQQILTPQAVSFLQLLWAAIQGQGGIIDLNLIGIPQPAEAMAAAVSAVEADSRAAEALGATLGQLAALRQAIEETGELALSKGLPSVSSPAAIGAVANLGGAPSAQEGTHAARPVAGNAGALYVETDTKTLWRDNGVTWDEIGSSGASVTISATAPSTPASGDVWWVNDTTSASAGRSKVWLPAGVAGTAGEWADLTPVQPGPAAWGTPAAWVTATAYSALPPASVVTQGGSTYVCLISHTSGVFATDLAAGKWLLVAQVGSTGATGLAGLPTAGGRLTLTSNTPVMTADATAQTAIYYTPYLLDNVPIYDGSVWGGQTFTQLTLNLDTTNHLSANLYDVFIWNNAGTISIGTGPAWSSLTARGTGAGTTELQMLNGIWTNKNTITLKNGAGAGTAGIAANKATYVGTFYATANGQTGMAFHPASANGGSNTILGVWNAYNRVLMIGESIDNTSWTYTTNATRAAHASNSNRVSWIDGLGQSFVEAVVSMSFSSSGAGFNQTWAVVVDSTSTIAGAAAFASATAAYNPEQNAVASNSTSPVLGFHFFQGTEQNNGGGTYTMNGNGNYLLRIRLEM